MHVNFKGFYLILFIVIVALIYFYAVPYIKHLLLHQDTKKLYASLEMDELPWKVYDVSTRERNIYLYEAGDGETLTLIMAAFHGDEQNSFHLAVELARSIYQNPKQIKNKVVIVPVVNPDGLLKRTRTNVNEVDINRNFPTENWTPVYQKKKNYPGYSAGSEKETGVVIDLINQYQPDRIISIHAPLKMNNFDGPAQELAEVMSRYNGYPVVEEIGYPTPGSLGTYAGVELKIPIVTLELPDISPAKAWEQNAEALVRAINF